MWSPVATPERGRGSGLLLGRVVPFLIADLASALGVIPSHPNVHFASQTAAQMGSISHFSAETCGFLVSFPHSLISLLSQARVNCRSRSIHNQRALEGKSFKIVQTDVKGKYKFQIEESCKG